MQKLNYANSHFSTMKPYFSLLLVAMSLFSIMSISNWYAVSPMQTHTSSNTYTPTQPGACTTTVTVGGTLVMASSGVTVTTTFPGRPVSAYTNATGVCFTGFIPPSAQGTPSGRPSDALYLDPRTALFLIFVVLIIGYLIMKKRK